MCVLLNGRNAVNITQTQCTSCTCNSVTTRVVIPYGHKNRTHRHIFVMALMQSEMPEQGIWLCGDVNFMHRTQHMLEHTHTFMQAHIIITGKYNNKYNKNYIYRALVLEGRLTHKDKVNLPRLPHAAVPWSSCSAMLAN